MSFTSVARSVALCGLITCASYGNESLNEPTVLGNVLGSIGTSLPIRLFSIYIHANVSSVKKYFYTFRCKLTDELASNQYQEWLKEAHVTMAIPLIEQKPVKILCDNDVPEDNDHSVIGCCSSRDMYLNESTLKSMSIGAQRCTVFHEAVHRKYHDDAVTDLAVCACYLAGSLSVCKAAHYIRSCRTFRSLALGMGAGALSAVITSIAAPKIKRFLINFCERRADIEAFYSSQCSKCVEGCIDKEFNDDDGSNGMGYLQASELRAIAQELHEHDALCTWHKVEIDSFRKKYLKSQSFARPYYGGPKPK